MREGSKQLEQILDDLPMTRLMCGVGVSIGKKLGGFASVLGNNSDHHWTTLRVWTPAVSKR